MKQFAEWCMCNKDYTYDSNLNVWFDSKTLIKYSWDEMLLIYMDRDPKTGQRIK